ncbi:MAG: uracil-DNA glycosylase [Candidatus Electryonea clarkiae]|nr:uracil-DNA glycosylase [Candidatus Electryonea clarkiae]MDP8285189.1 uracil-DNA glycosylase [Candidatus Electryonea clarkiae]
MNKQELKHEALRYLSQKSERNPLQWASPTIHTNTSVDNPEVDDDAYASPDIEQTMNPIQTESENIREYGAPDPEPAKLEEGMIKDPFPAYNEIDSFRDAICNCVKCPLGETRNKFVFGVGDPNADLVVVGEAPGADEDLNGEPFVGRAGKLLDKILDAVQLSRDNRVYIANILKCRPPNNRNPLQEEVALCEPYLIKQLQLIQPKIILALGRVAAQTLLKSNISLTKMREKVHDYHGVPLLVTYHPAALLRNPNWKRPAWEDVQKMRDMLG